MKAAARQPKKIGGETGNGFFEIRRATAAAANGDKVASILGAGDEERHRSEERRLSEAGKEHRVQMLGRQG